MIEDHRLRLTIWVLKLCKTKLGFGNLSLRLWSFINFSIGRLRIGDDLFSIVDVAHCWFAWQYFLFHWIVKSALPNVDRFLWTSTDEVVPFTTKFSIIWMSFECIFELSLLWVPYFGRPIVRWWNQIRAMRMKVNWFYWSLMTFVNLNDMLGSQIVKFDFFIMGTRSHTVSQGMKFCLVDDSIVLLISLNWLLGVKVPNNDLFVIARDNIGCSRWKFTVPDPIFVLFQCVLKSSVNRGPNFDQFIITTCRK